MGIFIAPYKSERPYRSGDVRAQRQILKCALNAEKDRDYYCRGDLDIQARSNHGFATLRDRTRAIVGEVSGCKFVPKSYDDAPELVYHNAKLDPELIPGKDIRKQIAYLLSEYGFDLEGLSGLTEFDRLLINQIKAANLVGDDATMWSGLQLMSARTLAQDRQNRASNKIAHGFLGDDPEIFLSQSTLSRVIEPETYNGFSFSHEGYDFVPNERISPEQAEARLKRRLWIRRVFSAAQLKIDRNLNEMLIKKIGHVDDINGEVEEGTTSYASQAESPVQITVEFIPDGPRGTLFVNSTTVFQNAA